MQNLLFSHIYTNDMRANMIQKILSFVVLAFCTFSVSAFPVAEGQQYSRMGRPVKEAPMVVEFFSFYCPPCMAFSREYKVSEAINQVLPEGTKVEKYHVGAMGSLGQNLTTAWSVAMALGVTDKVEHPLFIAVQDKKSLRNEEDIRQVFIDAGISATEYDAVKHSFVVKALTQKQIHAAQSFEVQGTPSFYVNGKYILNNNGTGETSPDKYGATVAQIVKALLLGKE